MATAALPPGGVGVAVTGVVEDDGSGETIDGALEGEGPVVVAAGDELASPLGLKPLADGEPPGRANGPSRVAANTPASPSITTTATTPRERGNRRGGMGRCA